MTPELLLALLIDVRDHLQAGENVPFGSGLELLRRVRAAIDITTHESTDGAITPQPAGDVTQAAPAGDLRICLLCSRPL